MFMPCRIRVKRQLALPHPLYYLAQTILPTSPPSFSPHLSIQALQRHYSLLGSKLRTYLPSSWYLHTQQQQQQNVVLPLSSSPVPPRMDAGELRRVFQMFDRNGDGRITQLELNDSLEKMGIFIQDKDLSQMIEKIDINRDGSVDINEFGELYQTIMDERNEEEDMKEAFNVFDRNGDGFITVDELKSVLASLGVKQGRTVEDCKQMIMRVDSDGDGRVNFSEFKQMMRGGGFAALTN